MNDSVSALSREQLECSLLVLTGAYIGSFYTDETKRIRPLYMMLKYEYSKRVNEIEYVNFINFCIAQVNGIFIGNVSVDELLKSITGGENFKPIKPIE